MFTSDVFKYRNRHRYFGVKMNKKILILSVLAAVLMVLLPISSVVGTNVVKSNMKKGSVDSPLFATRVNSFTQKDTKKIHTSFLGKGLEFNIFLTKRSSLDRWIDRAIKIVNAKPELLDKLLDKIVTVPGVINLLNENDISLNDFISHIEMIKNNPSLLEKEIEEAVQIAGLNLEIPINDPEPLGFSGQPGCFIAFLIILPILIMIGTMIATFTIITCLNIGGCFETIMQNIFESFAQGLTPL